MFLNSAPVLIEKINVAVSQKNFDELATQIHAYKTKWIMMGMNEAKDLALKIETQCRNIPPFEEAFLNSELLVKIIDNASEQLRKFS